MYCSIRRLVFLLVQVGSIGIYRPFGVLQALNKLWGDIKKNLWALIKGVDHLEFEVNLYSATGAKKKKKEAYRNISLLVSY